jgi:thioredoxin 1
MISPHFEKWSEKYSESVDFLKIDIDELPDAAEKYQISGVPSFIFRNGGEQISQIVGADVAGVENGLNDLKDI